MTTRFTTASGPGRNRSVTGGREAALPSQGRRWRASSLRTCLGRAFPAMRGFVGGEFEWFMMAFL